ncbi:putative ribonuclease H protein [Vitis vinifera]|uniref:Putative ribonuclease H protein n=1 Tax=Vitis vinifera TaxID=29760 RepID=A0A438HF86_VITVI|nr:putative ribonuclease H protein [Vitis vinifera]
MGYPSLSLRFAFVLSLSFAASHSSSSPFHLTRTAPPPSPSSFRNLKASASDVVALLGTRQQASQINAEEARQLRSCFKFLVPFTPNSIGLASGGWSIRRRLRLKKGNGRCRREEDELVWWPPAPVLELARLAFDSGGDPAAIHRTLDPTMIRILDASLIANEVIDFWHKRNEKGLICKLDIEKAYDSINWNFLMKVLVKMGFGSRWLEWIWWCISTAKFSIMINGVPAGFFSNSKGLRQGDPLSSYLFVLGMEVLSNLIRRAVDGGVLSGCRIRGRGEEEIVLIPVGEVEDIEELAVELSCKVGLLPTVYLGLPLGAHHKAVSIWDGVEERMRKRLAQWKRHYISKGGHITLIKCTMASLLIYNMSLFRMPKSVVKRLEKLQRDFLWGGGSLERKVHLINWEVVCTRREKGGLGIRKIDSLNKVLLGKWVWRFAVEKDNLWRLMIGVKYGQEEFGWRSKEARGTYGVGVWKEIMKEAKWCWENTKFKLYEMAVNRNATVNEMWDHSSGPGGWNIRFHRDFNDWELDLIRGLLIVLRDFKLSSEEDMVLWKGGGHGEYGVKDAYNGLVVINACDFSYRGVWVDKVPDVEGSKEFRCELTRTPYGRRFINEELNSYLEFLFELIAARGPDIGLNASLSRYDFFHGHLFLARETGKLGILFHAKEYPSYEKESFPYNMGYCQIGSNVAYDDSMNLRNILWLAPLPSNSSKGWVAPGVLVVLDARPGGIIYRDIIPDYVKFARTIYEDDFGDVAVDVNYLNVGNAVPDYQIFIC